MAEQKITQISPEQMERINQIYDERFRLEEQWRFEKAMEEKYDSGRAEGERIGELRGKNEGKLEGKSEIIKQMLENLSIEEVADILNMSIEEIESLL